MKKSTEKARVYFQNCWDAQFALKICKNPCEKKIFIEVDISPKIKYSGETNFATNLIQQLSIPAVLHMENRRLR